MAIFRLIHNTEDSLLSDGESPERPAFALEQADRVSENIIREILTLAADVCNMPTNYRNGNDKPIKAKGSCIDQRLRQLEGYLTKLANRPLSLMDRYTLNQLLDSIDELSAITLHLTHIAEVSKTIRRQKRPLSFPAQREVTELWKRLDTILNKLEEAFLKANSITGRWMLGQNSLIQEQIKAFKKNHIQRLRSGSCCVETGICFLELLYDYEQIAVHCTNLFGEEFTTNYLDERKG